ncbi:hypothetical protein NDU88_005783 [Pleurodeles waltl]|uniref:Uncharacterized protein n=1 Tax=Pleurodeles waltl TaxID=8319 RepID=A0AAV7TBM6_PLEWA|nr:hypothetical protein NDU88_005783 [Pleurodeles waltl]
MATAQAGRKDSSIKDMFAKPVGKKAEHAEKEGHLTPDATIDIDAPVTRPFVENLFTALRDAITAMKQELA